MIGLTVIDKTGNIATYNPHIQDNQVHFNIDEFKLGIELSALAIANQINAYVGTLDLANVTSITLSLNGNEVVYINTSSE